MAQFTVHPEALHAFADRADGYGDSLDTLATQVADARVGRDAFGHIPFVGSKIYDAYDEHVDQAEAGVEGRGGRPSTPSRRTPRRRPQGYEQAEQHNGG